MSQRQRKLEREVNHAYQRLEVLLRKVINDTSERVVTLDDIQNALSGLCEPDFEVHRSTAWYSEKTLIQAFGGTSALPDEVCVRVRLKSGMLELHARGDQVQILCYCCFVGSYDQGTFTLEQLPGAIQALKDHYCTPWPG